MSFYLEYDMVLHEDTLMVKVNNLMLMVFHYQYGFLMVAIILDLLSL